MKTINNSENYNNVVTEPLALIFKTYTSLISEYLLFCVDNVYIQKQKYLKYVLIRGIETLQNVFNILLLYTKNLELVNYHCQKSYYYYVEFIGQIGDDNHSFLQLNSKDATLFVYKKTIFEINNDFKKMFDSPSGSQLELIENIRSLTNIYNCIIGYCIDYTTEQLLDNNCELKKITNRIAKFSDKLLQLEKTPTFSNKLAIFNDFLKYTTIKNISCDKLVSLTELFIKRLCSKEITIKALEAKLYNTTFDSLIQTNSNIKIINWIFN